ncbi:MAG: hypothetical protein EOO07_25895 [Chitinophagaceae bacterium]|nr:MAG: hypothetical protein EOO07_25895 [Chitinophagaceae bacterium]
MSNPENKPKASIAVTAFLILTLSTTKMPPLLKYPMYAIAIISIIIVTVNLYDQFKANRLKSKASK